MSALRRFVAKVDGQLEEIEHVFVEGDHEQAGELIRDLSEYVAGIRATLDENRPESE